MNLETWLALPALVLASYFTLLHLAINSVSRSALLRRLVAREKDDPAQPNGVFLVERSFPPRTNGCVMRSIPVDGVDQQIGIQQDHLRSASFRASSASSSSSESCRALSRS